MATLRPFLLPSITALLLLSAVLSFISGHAGVLYGALALVWAALAIFFARPRLKIPKLALVVAIVALVSFALVFMLPGLALTFRLARIGMLAACALFICTMEFAPRGRLATALGLACGSFAFIVAAWYVESPLAIAMSEQSIGRFVQTMYRDGTPATPVASSILLSNTWHMYFVERDGRIYARPTAYDVMHAMRLDDPAHIAAVAQGAPPSTSPCSFMSDPPTEGYVIPGYARFEKQISAQCKQ